MSTHWLYLFNRIISSPLEILFTLLIFIIGKETEATPLQLTVLAASKPIVSLIAFYVSSFVSQRPYLVKLYLIILSMVGSMPCLFFSYFNNPWFFVFSFALFTTTSRAAFPAWCQILKSQIGLPKMSDSISKGSSINYLFTLMLPVIFSYWMDQDKEIWKMLFMLIALLHMSNIVILLALNLHSPLTILEKKQWINPLKNGWHLLKSEPAFTKYLLLFFLGGAGIVAMQSILPIYFKNDLQLSYTKLTLAFSFCKGVSFIVTSPLWARWSNYISLYVINGVMNFFTCLFILCMISSSFNLGWLYVGYLMYGTMQAGCEITWNLSGPVFSSNKDSTQYSSLNLALVGIRGCICPFLGQLIFTFWGVQAVFFSSLVVCLMGLIYAFRLDKLYKYQYVTEK